MTITTSPLTLTINGKQVGPMDVPDTLMMVDFLHEYLGLTGSRFGCGIGVCHACTVLLDGPGGAEEIRTCITGAHYFNGKRIRTIEGLAERDGQQKIIAITPVQQAYLDHYSFQCGYCTPGFVIGATALMERLKADPVRADQLEDTITEHLGRHICRCTGYVRYFEAAKAVILATPGLVTKEK
ncbi:(2Fe-2S)-binding protein [Pigmentiphaga sp. YJ18]|uniref:(2Fe-2S)-binding protein n=1 Tax=Pigmentiphaga sp. YJ18 TaxID=3134907 RepID=UPI00310F77AB